MFKRDQKKVERKQLAVKSSVIGLFSGLISIFLSFICRKTFLQYLGAELLGVDNTLLQILSTLSLTELGFQTTIIFLLYKPLAENDHLEISKIVMLLKKVYSVIGITVFGVGTALSPFLRIIITKVDVDNAILYSVYFIMLLGTSISYLFSYNRALLQADQKIYINNILDSMFQIVTSVGKIICIICFRNFILYEIMNVVSVIGSNIGSYIYYRKNYQWIDTTAKADKTLIKRVFQNVRDIFVGKLSGYVYSSTDNLVISALIGTNWVGFVGNYTTVINAIKMIIFSLTGPIQPMLGNFAVTNSKKETEKTLFNYNFIRFTMAFFLVIPTICLSDMFVFIFYGKNFVLDPLITILLSSDLYIICMQGSVAELIDAVGFFKQERNLYLFYAIINLGFSCLGAYLWGIIPVFLATVISQLIGWFWRSIIAYKDYFHSKKSFLQYWKNQFVKLLLFISTTILSSGLLKIISLPLNILGFVGNGIIVELVCLTIFYFSFRNKPEYKYLLQLVKKLIPTNNRFVGA